VGFAVSTPRPKAKLPDWRPNDVLEVVGYGAVVQFTVTVVEKPTPLTTLIRTNDTQKTMLVSNQLLRKKVT
jgi:hypothetical protein